MTNLWHKIIITYLVLMAWLAIPFFYPPIQIDLRVISIVIAIMATLIILLVIIALNPDYDEDLVKRRKNVKA